MRRQPLRLAGLSLLFLVAGCHSYHSATTSIPAGAKVRVRFSPMRTVNLRAPGGATEPVEVWEITGTLVTMRGDTIVMRPSRVGVKNELEERRVIDQELALLRDAGTEFGVYRTDIAKTTLLTTVITATVLVGGFYVLIAAAMMSSD